MLIAIGLLLLLALYTGTTGVVGRAIADRIGQLIGLARFTTPILVLFAGWQVLRSNKGRKRRRSLATVEYLAWGLLFVALFSLLDMIGRRPNWDSSMEELSKGGGFVGVMLGGTIDHFFGRWGQFIVTLLLVCVAAVFLTPVSFGPIVDRVSDRIADAFFGATGNGSELLRRQGGFGGLWSAGSRNSGRSRSEGRGRSSRGSKAKPVFGSDDPNDDPSDDDGEFYIDLRPGGDDESTDLESKSGRWSTSRSKGKGKGKKSTKHDTETGDTLDETVDTDDDAESSFDGGDADDIALPIDGGWDSLEPVISVPETSVVNSFARAVPPDGVWSLPKIDILERTEAPDVDRNAVYVEGRKLEHALAEHGVETRLVGVTVGPTVSQFELELGPGVKVARVTSLHKDIAYAMATPDVRILAPIPGKQAIGVEVPNQHRQIITVGDLLNSEEAAAATHPLEVTLGRDITGKTVMVNLAKMPHLLVAGQTGSGKSSCLNSMLTSILMRSTPEQVRLILVDPKRVELTQYEGLPHLLTEVVTDPKKAANALSWAVGEMERRYDLLQEVSVRDLNGYNRSVEEGKFDGRHPVGGDEDSQYQKLCYIVIVLDELADLMMVAARDVEESICRIAQKARAVGIHLVIATQRPSTNVITGLIKANVPARLAFAVSSLTDSRVILDQPGAERLVGRGDGLLNDGSTSQPMRFQGAWVTEEEVEEIVALWVEQAPDVLYDSRVVGEEVTGGPAAGIPGGTTGDEGDDELIIQAMELIVRSQLGSTSMLQRKLRVGFARAGRLMDLLEERGVVGPSVGSKAREVLMTPQDLDSGNFGAQAGGGAAGTPPVSGQALFTQRSGVGPRSGPKPAKPDDVEPVEGRSDTPQHPTVPTSIDSQPIVEQPKRRRKTLADLQFPQSPQASPPAKRPPLPPLGLPDLEPDPELGLDKRDRTQPGDNSHADIGELDDSNDHDGAAHDSSPIPDGRVKLRVIESPEPEEPARPPVRRPTDPEPLPEPSFDVIDGDLSDSATASGPASDDEFDLDLDDEFDDEYFDDGEEDENSGDPALAPPSGYRPRG